MRRRSYLFTIILLTFTVTALGQVSGSKPDPEVSKMIKEVSAKNIEATILKLVSFGTRNTLSVQDDPNRGIGAARDWLFAEFQRISAACGGCLDVQKQSFVQPAVNRIPQPTT